MILTLSVPNPVRAVKKSEIWHRRSAIFFTIFKIKIFGKAFLVFELQVVPSKGQSD